MAKDTRRGAPPPTPKRKQNRSCVWVFVLGIVIGVVSGNFISTRREATDRPPEASTTPARNQQPTLVQPHFKFQEILSDPELDVSGKAPPPPPSAPRPQPPVAQPSMPVESTPDALPPTKPAAAPRSGTYVVQAGSFSSAADADRRKAELALLGISSSVQAATLPNGKKAYRVRTGSYSSKQSAEQVRAQLKRNGKEGMTIPIK